MEKERFSDLPIKDKYAYTAAFAALMVGFGLTIGGFIVPPLGAVDNSVLWILGQALTFAGAVFGLALYTKAEVRTQVQTLADNITPRVVVVEKPSEEPSFSEEIDP